MVGAARRALVTAATARAIGTATTRAMAGSSVACHADTDRRIDGGDPIATSSRFSSDDSAAVRASATATTASVSRALAPSAARRPGSESSWNSPIGVGAVTVPAAASGCPGPESR